VIGSAQTAADRDDYHQQLASALMRPPRVTAMP